MEEVKKLTSLTQIVSESILETKQLASILETIYEGENEADTLIVIMERNLQKAFKAIEDCREIISNPD